MRNHEVGRCNITLDVHAIDVEEEINGKTITEVIGYIKYLRGSRSA